MPFFITVPESPPHGMEAIQFNRTSVFLKWQPPYPNKTRNGILTNYNVIVKGLDAHNTTRIYKNMTIDASSPTLLLANLTTGVTYYIAVAAATRVGVGPFSKPAVLRMDPRTQSLDTGYTRYPINRDIADDFLTQTWFIVLLGSIIAIIVFLFGALVLFKRYQFIKQTSLGSLHGNHAIGAVRKFPTLPLNANGVWIDPTGGVWRQANNSSSTTKEQLPDYAQVTGQATSQSHHNNHQQQQQQNQPNMPLPDYERLTPLNMPDYAEVACSTFKTPNGGSAHATLLQQQQQQLLANNKAYQQQQQQQQSLYDSCGAYATTNLVANAKLYQNRGNGTNTATSSIKTNQGDRASGDILDGLRDRGNEQKLLSSSTMRSNNNDDYRSTMGSITSSLYSAPPSNHYGGGGGGSIMGMDNNAFGNNLLSTFPDKMTASTASTAILSASPSKSVTGSSSQKKSTTSSSTLASSTSNTTATGNKINITENRFDLMNNEPLQPTRLNPFNTNSMQSQSQRQQQQQQQQLQQQQLLVASNALKQGLGAYAN
ncbi:putative uncharacterized protein DDB_G0282129, partial [Musca vetustissima]|uniref:putative uncharacterized protein DDB_G0282129 n=1 Tax=Musca vetustissima TaxID=27455 RepID=UPI002AB69798